MTEYMTIQMFFYRLFLYKMQLKVLKRSYFNVNFNTVF